MLVSCCLLCILYAKAEVFKSFLLTKISLMSLFCLIFSKNIMFKVIDNGHFFSHSPPPPRCSCPFTFICQMLLDFKEKIPVAPVKWFFLVKRYHCCMNLASVCIGHYVPIQMQIFNNSLPFISVTCSGSTRIFVYILLS